jgi:hypothetical protein
MAPHVHREEREKPAYDEGKTPAQPLDLVHRKKQSLHDQHEAEVEQLSGDDTDLQEAHVETAAVSRCHLAQIGGAGSIFPSALSPCRSRAAMRSTGANTPIV